MTEYAFHVLWPIGTYFVGYFVARYYFKRELRDARAKRDTGRGGRKR